MELSDMVLNGNDEAWVPWKGPIEILLKHIPPSRDREMQQRFLRPQWRGHQRMEDEIDHAAMRDYYCTQVIKGMRGLTKDGQPFEPGVEDFKRFWDGNRDFQNFVAGAAFRLENFVAEKKS